MKEKFANIRKLFKILKDVTPKIWSVIKKPHLEIIVVTAPSEEVKRVMVTLMYVVAEKALKDFERNSSTRLHLKPEKEVTH